MICLSMTWYQLKEDMVTPLTPLTANVCITHLEALNATACMCQTILHVPLGDWFTVSRRRGTGER